MKASGIFIFIILTFLLSSAVFSQNPFDLAHRIKTEFDTTQGFSDSLKVIDPSITDQWDPDSESIRYPMDTASRVIERFKSDKDDAKILPESPSTLKPPEEKAVTESPPKIRKDKSESHNLLLLIFLVCSIFLALIILADRSVLNKLFRALINDNFLNFFMREQKGGTSLQLFFLHLFFIINLGILAYFFADNILNLQTDFRLWQCILAVGGIYLVRHFSMIYLKLFVKAGKEINQFYFTIIIFNIFLGLLVFPLNALAAFGPDIISNTAIYISLFFLIIFYLVRQLRGLFIGSKFLADHQFHFFIYLCTVEIAPLLILGKIFVTIS